MVVGSTSCRVAGLSIQTNDRALLRCWPVCRTSTRLLEDSSDTFIYLGTDCCIVTLASVIKNESVNCRSQSLCARRAVGIHGTVILYLFKGVLLIRMLRKVACFAKSFFCLMG